MKNFIPQKIFSIAFPFSVVLLSLSFTVSTYAAETAVSTTPPSVREFGFKLSVPDDKITIGRLIINNPAPPLPSSSIIKLDWSKIKLPVLPEREPGYLIAPKNTQPTVVEVRGTDSRTFVSEKNSGNFISAPGSCKEGICSINRSQSVEPPALPPVVVPAPEPPQPPPSPEPAREPSPQVDPVVVPPSPPSDPVLAEQVPPPPPVVETPRILPFIVPVSAESTPVLEEKKVIEEKKSVPSFPSRPREARINVKNAKVDAPQNIQVQAVQPVQPTVPVSRVVQEVKQPVVTRRPTGVFKRTGLFFRRLFSRDRQ